jgi:SnoaL-like protein
VTDIALPAPIQAFVDTTNRADVEGFLEVFTPDATLDDWGRTFTGLEGIARWNRTDNIGKQSRFGVLAVAPGPEADSYVVTLRVTGSGFNGSSPITFQLREDRIARIVIAPN